MLNSLASSSRARSRRTGLTGVRHARRKQEVTQIADHVAALTVDLDEVATLGEVVDHRLFKIQLIAQLIEIGHFQFGTVLYGTGGGLELAEHQFEQGTLARAVVADQADAVPPQHMGGQLTDQRRLARPGEADLVQLDHPLARRIGSPSWKLALP